MKPLKIASGILTAVTLMLGVHTASATPITNPQICLPGSTTTDCLVRLDVGNADLTSAGYTGPYITGTIHLVDNHTANLTFTSATQLIGTQTVDYKFGDLWFNLANYPASGVSVAASNISFSGNKQTTNFTFGAPPGQGNISQFGLFDIGASDQNGYGKAVTSLSFTLTATGMTWADAGSLLQVNANGASAAGHIYVAGCSDSSCTNLSSDALKTGFAGWPCANEPTCGVPNVNVPEPRPLALFGAGLVVLMVVRRRFQKI